MAGSPKGNDAIDLKARAHHPLISTPVRDSEGPKDPVHFKPLVRSIASYFPSLKRRLAQGNMEYTPTGYVMLSLVSAAYISFALVIVSWLFFREAENSILIALGLLPVLYFLAFIYSMQLPSVKASLRAKRMEQELVFAGRHMLISLKSGVALFDAMLGVSREYGEVSKEFNKIVEKVTLGVPMNVALHEVAENNPSLSFNRMILQMANSLSSGSDVVMALESSLDQISKEQVIAIKSYGQKLNPIVMFFMIFGIIMPSLGVAFVLILVSFLGGSGISFGSSALFGILVGVGLVQFIFLSMVESSRPKFDIY